MNKYDLNSENILKILKDEKESNKYKPIVIQEHINSSINRCINKVEEEVSNFKDNIGEFSDGYHTFNELYHHRAILTAVIFNTFKDKAWKSKKHHDGTMYDNMFIVGIETPDGSATYHYDIEPYWDMFDIKELPSAPEWDGHTPDDAIKRIYSLINEGKTNEK